MNPLEWHTDILSGVGFGLGVPPRALPPALSVPDGGTILHRPTIFFVCLDAGLSVTDDAALERALEALDSVAVHPSSLVCGSEGGL
jgi:hypothetical protein